MLFPPNIRSYLLIARVNWLIFHISDYIVLLFLFFNYCPVLLSFLAYVFWKPHQINSIHSKLCLFLVSLSVVKCSQYVSIKHSAVLTWLLYFLNSSSSLLPPNPVFWIISLFLLTLQLDRFKKHPLCWCFHFFSLNSCTRILAETSSIPLEKDTH